MILGFICVRCGGSFRGRTNRKRCLECKHKHDSERKRKNKAALFCSICGSQILKHGKSKANVKACSVECRKEGARRRTREWSQKNPNRARENAKRWVLKNPEKRKEIARRWVKKHGLDKTRKDRARNPQKYKARTAVGNAIRDGKLKKKPCCVCGSEFVHAHHEDYGRPLDVVWVCVKHHKEIHSTLTIK